MQPTQVYKVLVRKPERNRPHGRSRHTWEYNIKWNLGEKRMISCGLDSFDSGKRPVAGLLTW
jgi:hypothetical protein